MVKLTHLVKALTDFDMQLARKAAEEIRAEYLFDAKTQSDFSEPHDETHLPKSSLQQSSVTVDRHGRLKANLPVSFLQQSLVTVARHGQLKARARNPWAAAQIAKLKKEVASDGASVSEHATEGVAPTKQTPASAAQDDTEAGNIQDSSTTSIDGVALKDEINVPSLEEAEERELRREVVTLASGTVVSVNGSVVSLDTAGSNVSGTNRTGRPGSGGAMSGVGKICHVNDTGDLEDVMRQLRGCAESLEKYSQVVEEGRLKSRSLNEAEQQEMLQVRTLLSKLRNRTAIVELFDRDQANAERFLLGELDKADIEISNMNMSG
mmetsp:Transcript_15234/g.45619  ORF Transcript_15234/g.45619 Transcript_15234/m.45619 type:complete len:322 (-) Transcript_15234:81-1046(-)